jgi:lysophospholipid acyltransferase
MYQAYGLYIQDFT